MIYHPERRKKPGKRNPRRRTLVWRALVPAARSSAHNHGLLAYAPCAIPLIPVVVPTVSPTAAVSVPGKERGVKDSESKDGLNQSFTATAPICLSPQCQKAPWLPLGSERACLSSPCRLALPTLYSCPILAQPQNMDIAGSLPRPR